MKHGGFDPLILNAWVSAHAMGRGSPQPVAEYGGYRVDTRSDKETIRWVFPRMGPGLIEIARRVEEPRHFLKLCGPVDELRSALPGKWTLDPPGFFMQAAATPLQRRLPDGYAIEICPRGPVTEVRVRSEAGELAANGYATETHDVFVCDRIATAPEHRRKGLGNVVMAILREAKRDQGSRELLVATEDGRALYSTLGWRTISPFSTSSIPAPESATFAD